MADENTGDQPLTEAGFQAAYGEELLGFLNGGTTADTAAAPAENGDTSVVDDAADTGDAAREAVVDETGRHHDPETGKFVDKPKDGDDDGDEETTEEGEDEAEDAEGLVIEVDDEETAERVSELLEKYDGDVAKALAAAVEAQKLIGRKESERSQATAEAAELRARLEAIEAGQQAVLTRLNNPTVPITADLIQTDPALAAEQAALQGNMQALEAAITVWRNGSEYVDANPHAANLFLQNLLLQEQLKEASTTTPAAQVVGTPEEDREVAKVLEKHPDLEQYLPAIAAAADENPLLKRAMETGSATEKAQALEALTVIAKSRQGADTSRDAIRRVQVVVKKEADDARRAATVVSASRGSAAAASQPTKVDQFLEAFDARLGIKRED